MHISKFRPSDKTETLLLEIVKDLHEVEEITHTKKQDTLEIKMSTPKQISNFVQLLFIPEN